MSERGIHDDFGPGRGSGVEDRDTGPLPPRLLLQAYRSGIFPMPDVSGVIEWYAPDPRAVLPLSGLRVSRSLRRTLRSGRFAVTRNSAFGDVIRACADRSETWITRDIVEAYEALHVSGDAHSVECWMGDRLAGGLYGVAIGGAFFGESMFHVERDASKVALVYLVRNLQKRGFGLLDVQFLTDHLARLGAVEISRLEYQARLTRSLSMPCTF